MRVQGLPFVFNDLFDVALLGVIELNFFDAIVGAQVALIVFKEEFG